MSEHYFTPTPSSDAGERTVSFRMDDRSYALRAAHGVFSAERLDLGTRMLLERGPRPPASGVLLDLGCGYGPIACVLAMRSPDAEVWAVDVNERARSLTERNAASLGLTNVRVTPPDAVPDDLTFAAIYSNPPIHIGKPALHELLHAWLSRLEPDGAAYLVVQRNLGADSLHRWLASEGYVCDRLASAKGYRVLGAARSR